MLRMLGEKQGGWHGKDQTCSYLPSKANLRLKGQHLFPNILCQPEHKWGTLRKTEKSHNTIVSISWQNRIGKDALQLIEKQTIWATRTCANNMSVEHAWGSWMSCTGKEEMKGQKKGSGQKVLQWVGVMARGCKPDTWPQKGNYSSYRGVSPDSFKNHKSLPDKHILIMPNKEEGEIGGKKRSSIKNKREMSNINGSLIKMTTSHLCHFYSILYLDQHGLKLKLKPALWSIWAKVNHALCSEC